ncbi:MAG TPA: electron transport complex subunit E [Bacteroidia bacterium]|nr:electron transport complex subunit E [Bacteroidia bacterium]
MPEEITSRSAEEFRKGLWKENQIFVTILGLCPALAVTNSAINGLAMGVATTVVLILSNFLISIFRNVIPNQVRITAFIVIIATLVQVIDFSLAALFPKVHKELGAFIALIVVNCIILGRAESFAAKNTPWLSVLDGAGMGVGFTFALLCIGVIREILGSGSAFNIGLFGDKFEPWVIMILPPGGFFTLGFLLLMFSWYAQRKKNKLQQAEK